MEVQGRLLGRRQALDRAAAVALEQGDPGQEQLQLSPIRRHPAQPVLQYLLGGRAGTRLLQCEVRLERVGSGLIGTECERPIPHAIRLHEAIENAVGVGELQGRKR